MTSRLILANNMKKTLFLIVLLLIMLSPSSTTALYAQNTPASPTGTGIKNNVGQEQQITNLKQRADKEITRRVTSLNNLLKKLNTMKRLTDQQRSNFSSQIQTEISNLNNLKIKIDGDTDLTTLRADVKSIVASYRVYALFIPQIRLFAAAGKTTNIADQMSLLAGKLQTRIQNASAQGKNVTPLQTTLSDMQTKIADAKTQSQNVMKTVVVLSPAGYPANQTVLLDARAILKTAHQDLVLARKDAGTIVKQLKSLNTSASPTKAL